MKSLKELITMFKPVRFPKQKELYEMTTEETMVYLASIGIDSRVIESYKTSVDTIEEAQAGLHVNKEMVSAYDYNAPFINNFRSFSRVLRFNRGIVMGDMAKTMGVGVAELSSIEHGKQPIPLDWFDKLEANYYNDLSPYDQEVFKLLKDDSLSV